MAAKYPRPFYNAQDPESAVTSGCHPSGYIQDSTVAGEGNVFSLLPDLSGLSSSRIALKRLRTAEDGSLRKRTGKT